MYYQELVNKTQKWKVYNNDADNISICLHDLLKNRTI